MFVRTWGWGAVLVGLTFLGCGTPEPMPSCRSAVEYVGASSPRVAKGRPLTVPLFVVRTAPVVATVKSGSIPGMALAGASFEGTPSTLGESTVTFELTSQAGDCTPADLNLTLTVVEPECEADEVCRYIGDQPCTATSQCMQVGGIDKVCAPTVDGKALCVDKAVNQNTCGSGTQFAQITTVESVVVDTCLIATGQRCVASLCAVP